METITAPSKKRATRNPIHVQKLIEHYAQAYRDCVRNHWTLEQYLAARSNVPAHPTLTHFDQGQVYATRNLYFNLVNGPDHLEWRLGFEDISTAKVYQSSVDSGLMPTHGAHFWKGTDIPFNGWNKF